MAREIKRTTDDYSMFRTEKPIILSTSSSLNLAYAFIPSIGWDKPAYAVMNGKLRQVFIKRIEFYTRNINHRTNGSYFSFSSENAAYVLNVAGIGEVVVKQTNGWRNPSFDLFDSVEDFRNNKPYKLSDDSVGTDIFEMFRCALGEDERYTIGNGYATMYQWRWDADKCEPVKVGASIPSTIIYTKEDGFFFDKPWVLPRGLYATKEDCIENNEIEVVTFDGSSCKTEHKEKIAFLGCVMSAGKDDVDAIIDLLKDLGLIVDC